MSPSTLSPLKLSPLLLLILIDTIGYSIMVPGLAPALLANEPEMMSGYSAHARYIVYGFALGVYELMMLYMAPVLGEVSDRIGRRRVLVLCIAGSAASFIMLGVGMTANLVVLLILGRIVGGATAGSQAVAQAAVVDHSSPDTKATALSLCLFASSLGFILGPVLGGVLSDDTLVAWFDSATPLYIVAVLSLLSLMLLLATEPRDEAVYDVPVHEISLPADVPHLAAIEEGIARIHDSLDIENGPMLAVGLFRGHQLGEDHFFFVMHELVTDAMSLQVVLEDLRRAYRLIGAGEPVALPARTTSYRQWVSRVMDYAQIGPGR